MGERELPQDQGSLLHTQAQQPAGWAPAPLVMELETYQSLEWWSALPGVQQLWRTELL